MPTLGLFEALRRRIPVPMWAKVAGPAAPEPVSDLYQAQKMEALGRLTGGVAHDFNNLLTVVLGNATALRMAAESRGDAQGVRRAEMIERSAERGGRLAGQLLAFSRKQVLQPATVSPYRVISAMHDMLGQAAGETVRVVVSPDPDLWNCHVDPGQLESAVLNLVLNARDAMPVGGDVTVSFRNRRLSAADAPRSGDYVQIDVRDTGTGIPPELLDKVFEPFFTTKPVGQGSGLGLAQVHGFAGQSRGWVALRSEVGLGTTVSLFLPRDQAPRPDGATEREAPGPLGANETVLVVEPDDDVRTTVAETLDHSGYRTIPVANASGALAHLVGDGPIDLLLTEEALPGGVSGAFLAADSCRLRPGLQALITSGTIGHAAHALLDKLPGAELLMKPYQTADLVRVVGGILKRKSFSTETEQILADARETEADGQEAGADAVPPRPAAPSGGNSVRLGIKPFRMMGGGLDQAFAAGLAEEIARAFAPFRSVTCVAPGSLAAGAPDPSLGLDFLLQGTLRRKGDDIRIVVRLLNMRGSGEIAWGRRFDSRMSDALSLQDQIASETAARVAPELMVWTGREAMARPTVDPAAYDLMLRAIPAIYCLDDTDFQAAGRLLEQALALDPANAACHSWMAHWYLFSIGQGRETDIETASQRASQHAQRAVVLDANDARAFTVAGHVRAFLQKDPQGALWLHERAIELNPNLALAWCYSGLAHSYLGQHAEAIRRIERAQQLSPRDPHAFFFNMALVMPYLLTGQYEAAARLGRRARDANPGLSSTHKGLLAALGQLRAAREAAVLRDELLSLEPGFSIREAVARSPLLRQADLRRYIEGLRLAGIPERIRLAG